MKQFEVKALGLEELTNQEMKTIEGGKPWKYRWSGTSNPIIYFGEAIYNGVVAVHNLVDELINGDEEEKK